MLFEINVYTDNDGAQYSKRLPTEYCCTNMQDACKQLNPVEGVFTQWAAVIPGISGVKIRNYNGRGGQAYKIEYCPFCGQKLNMKINEVESREKL
jgi:hypothetical protein